MRLLLVVLACLVPGCVLAPAAVDAQPDIVLGALGTSFMLGWNADADHAGAHPEVSWVTGDAEWSFASRVRAAGSENVAEGGAASTRFAPQARNLTNATLVLASFLDSELCASVSAVTGTPPGASTFEQDLRDGVQELRARGVDVMLLTQPDIKSIAEAARARPPVNDQAGFYAVGQECAAEPGLEARQAAMNALIVRVAEEEGVLSDGGATARIAWSPDMVSTLDGFHPGPAGLRAMADAVWAAYEAVRPGP